MAEYQIGIENWKPIRKKPVLTLINNSEHIKVASFNNQESADLFYNVFCTNYVKSTDKAIRTIRELQSKSEEVCEWEKGSSGYVGYPAYYSKCCTTNSNGLEMQTHIISDWKYCPYCGRKIKVVE